MSVFHTRHPMGRALDERDTPFTGESDARGHVPPRTPLTPTSLYFDREGARRGGMSHSASFLRLDRITPPLEQISHIWTSLRQIDRNYITSFVGDVPMLSTRRVDWNFLGAAVTFWDPTHAVFNIQGTELTPIIEEYRTLIGRTAISHGIVEPNLRTTRLDLRG
ncbi:hypothetical protein CDL15_Pgr012252 [Punica granatum]|uniref:Uncharacterized protein n=1 Tax=Punica granatum TaxID=22663 RepID=A0A218WTJ8_PUNGR|nr:hypothetical protein CDL15_Pgr012252 [Punica granatum]